MRRYEQYKPSGLDWLADVPSHWQVVANRALFKERQEAGEDGLPVLSVSLHTGVSDDEQNEEENARTRTRMADRTSYKRVRPGDVAYNMMRAWQGAIGAVRTDGLVSPAYVVAAPTAALNPAYFEYLYRTDWLIGEMNRASKGITDFRKRLYWQEFKQLSTLLPPCDEQDRIVAFLDQKTAEIDSAIAKKAQLIELLEESKRCLVYDAVTRGLHGAVPLKKSGLSWLSNVPEHWELKRLKSVASFITSGPRGWSDRLSDDGAVFLQSGNLNNSLGIELDSAHRVVVPRGAEAKRTRLQDGDVLVCITGANTGRVAVASLGGQEAYINQHLSLIRLADANPRFVAYSLAAQGGSYFYLCQYGLKEGLSLFDVANAPIIIPPLDEQNEIVAFLDQSVAKVDAALAAAASQCGQLEELKKAVIASAVTGRSVRR